MLVLSNDVMAALTIYSEARGESFLGKQLVAATIFNRSLVGEIYRGDESLRVAQAVLRPQQFSCWNTDDPNRKVMALLDDQDYEYQACLAAWQTHKYLAIPLTVKHYHSVRVKPYWADSSKVFVREGNHIFYAGIA